MLEAIRRAMPREAMLTTEGNGETFVRWFDGYLNWHRLMGDPKEPSVQGLRSL